MTHMIADARLIFPPKYILIVIYGTVKQKRYDRGLEF